MVVGGTSPLTVFFPSPFNHEKLHFKHLHGSKLFTNQPIPLYKRNEEFIRYIYSMSRFIPGFDKIYSCIHGYLELSLKNANFHKDLKQELIECDGSIYLTAYDNILASNDPQFAVEVNGYNINCQRIKSDNFNNFLHS